MGDVLAGEVLVEEAGRAAAAPAEAALRISDDERCAAVVGASATLAAPPATDQPRPLADAAAVRARRRSMAQRTGLS